MLRTVAGLRLDRDGVGAFAADDHRSMQVELPLIEARGDVEARQLGAFDQGVVNGVLDRSPGLLAGATVRGAAVGAVWRDVEVAELTARDQEASGRQDTRHHSFLKWAPHFLSSSIVDNLTSDAQREAGGGWEQHDAGR